MNLLSEIISKPVLNLYSGKIEGTVKDAIFDRSFKKIQYLKIFDEEEEEYLLSSSKIYSIGSSSLVIKNSEALQLETESNKTSENNPINFEVFSSNGDNLGTLLDIELEENLEVKNLITSNLTIPQSNIVNISKIIIVNNTDKKIKCSDFKPKIKGKKNKNTSVIKIMPILEEKENYNNTIIETDTNQNAKETHKNNMPIIETPANEKTPNTQENNTIQNQNKQNIKQGFKISTTPTPQRVMGNGNFLIGRKVIKTIYGINNEILIKKDSIITSKNLESAKKHSKLVELTVYSKVKP